jgi:hypothetical protein
MATPHQHSAEKNAPWFTKPGMTDRLVVLHGEGITHGNIARILEVEYGIPVTRNQVIGKAQRLKLARRKPAEPRPKLPRHKLEARPPKPRKKKPQPLPPLSDGRPGSPRPSIPLPPPPPMMLWLPPLLPAVALPLQELRLEDLPVLALDSGQCKFPDGEYPFQFCGRPQVEGSAYCQEHLKIIFRSRESQ